MTASLNYLRVEEFNRENQNTHFKSNISVNHVIYEVIKAEYKHMMWSAGRHTKTLFMQSIDCHYDFFSHIVNGFYFVNGDAI